MSTQVGIIGYGGFGRFLHRAWSGIGEATVTWIVDAQTMTIPSGAKFDHSWAKLLADRDVDLVSIATPPDSHAEIAAAFLERDINVLIEKPVATTAADAADVLEAAESSSALATVDFMLRFNPIISCIHRWCRTGEFGRLQRVVVENYAQDESLNPDHWFWDESQSGGILVEHGVHFFDMVNAATTARPSSVIQQSWKRRSGLTDRVFALVQYEDGLVASHYHAFNRLNDFERTTIRFVFDAAQVEVFGWIPLEGRIVALCSSKARSTIDELPQLSILNRRTLKSRRMTPLADDTGAQYEVDTLVTAHFELGISKEQAYLQALRALMSDFVRATVDPSHVLQVRLEDGIAALHLALGQVAGR